MANRLTLIYPSMHSDVYSSELLYNPLALAYVGAYTPPDWEITLYDEYVDDFVDPDAIDADLVAMSALTPNIPRAYYLAEKLKKRGIPTICGGAHVSALPEEGQRYFDSVVSGEAETIWPTVMADFEQGRLKGFYDGRMDGATADIRLPRRDLIHPRYEYPSLISSKGCPFRCDYCYLSVFEKKRYRTLPVDAIMEDLDIVSPTAGFAAIFVDENVSGYSKANFENRAELFERMARKNYKFVWGAQSTIDIYKKPEMLKLMHASGCRALFVGLESVSSDLGQQVNKRFADRIDYAEAVKVLHRHGIAVIGSFILGLDSQDKTYARELPKRVKEMNIEYPRLFYLTAWPGTPLSKRLEEQGRLQKGYCHVRKDIPNIRYMNFSDDEIREAEHYIKKSFFSKPYLVKVVLRWLFRDPAMVLFFIRMLKSNTSPEAQALKKEQREKERFMKRIIEEHFKGTEMDESENLYKAFGGEAC